MGKYNVCLSKWGDGEYCDAFLHVGTIFFLSFYYIRKIL